MPLIARGVGHVYRKGEPGEARALSGIDIVISPGDFVLVAGANGSGKSTLLQCLSGLVKPTEGKVTIDGLEAKKSRSLIAMAIQFPERALFAETVYDDVAFGPLNVGVKKEAVSERVNAAIDAVGLGRRLLGLRPAELSHGQRRLAALAGVIAVRPAYLFLDEPTAGLDARGKDQVMRALAGLSQAGTAIVVASHDLERMMGACRRVVVLSHGQKALDGTPGDLVTMEDTMGLALPASVRASRWLKGRGVEVPWNIGPEELARRIRDEGMG